MRKRFTTEAQLQREIVSCSAMAAMSAERRQVAGMIYWQSCAGYLKDLLHEVSQGRGERTQ